MSTYFSDADRARMAYLFGAMISDATTLRHAVDDEREIPAGVAQRLEENLHRLRIHVFPELEPFHRTDDTK